MRKYSAALLWMLGGFCWIGTYYLMEISHSPSFAKWFATGMMMIYFAISTACFFEAGKK